MVYLREVILPEVETGTRLLGMAALAQRKTVEAATRDKESILK